MWAGGGGDGVDRFTLLAVMGVWFSESARAIAAGRIAAMATMVTNAVIRFMSEDLQCVGGS